MKKCVFSLSWNLVRDARVPIIVFLQKATAVLALTAGISFSQVLAVSSASQLSESEIDGTRYLVEVLWEYGVSEETITSVLEDRSLSISEKLVVLESLVSGYTEVLLAQSQGAGAGGLNEHEAKLLRDLADICGGGSFTCGGGEGHLEGSRSSSSSSSSESKSSSVGGNVGGNVRTCTVTCNNQSGGSNSNNSSGNTSSDKNKSSSSDSSKSKSSDSKNSGNKKKSGKKSDKKKSSNG